MSVVRGRRTNPPKPTLTRAIGFCSMCPSLPDADVVEVSHAEAKKAPDGGRYYWRICVRCAALIGAAAGSAPKKRTFTAANPAPAPKPKHPAGITCKRCLVTSAKGDAHLEACPVMRERGPSAAEVAAGRVRDDFSDLVDDFDLLPDVGVRR